jgi:hypothetical protein
MARVIIKIVGGAMILTGIAVVLFGSVFSIAGYPGKCIKWHFQLSRATSITSATRPSMDWICDHRIPYR